MQNRQNENIWEPSRKGIEAESQIEFVARLPLPGLMKHFGLSLDLLSISHLSLYLILFLLSSSFNTVNLIKFMLYNYLLTLFALASTERNFLFLFLVFHKLLFLSFRFIHFPAQITRTSETRRWVEAAETSDED
jgi:hypothetical protein